ncbi:SsrA-binding protein SmpB [Candidatus Gottesmanbacteria bacterium]|nr:SsrA-binding protein SmpB [Candidatus Gottesmanbacteria bacterium]
MNIVNKKAYSEYIISETLEVGIKLLGAEVKSIKGGRINLNGSFVKIVGSEIYLVNAGVPLYPYARVDGYDPNRTRKLLLHKKEIMFLKSKIERSGLTIVPLKCYTKGGFIKLEIGIGRGKKQYEKREELRKEAIQRDIDTAIRGKY